MHRTLLAIAAIIAATGYLLQSLPAAQAQSMGPVVSAGEAPWHSFTGEVAGGTTEAIYTVPSDQVFVLTGACSSYPLVNIYEDSNLKVDGGTYAFFCSSTHVGMLGLNSSHIVFDGGTTITIDAPYSDTEYLLQGYLAHP